MMEWLDTLINALVGAGPMGLAVIIMLGSFAITAVLAFFGFRFHIAQIRHHNNEKLTLMGQHTEKQDYQNTRLSELLEKSTEAQCANANALNSVCKLVERVDTKIDKLDSRRIADANNQ
jgi:hypothetical protein